MKNKLKSAILIFSLLIFHAVFQYAGTVLVNEGFIKIDSFIILWHLYDIMNFISTAILLLVVIIIVKINKEKLTDKLLLHKLKLKHFLLLLLIPLGMALVFLVESIKIINFDFWKLPFYINSTFLKILKNTFYLRT